ncbi:hypothetical protein DL767_003616 [Monosporascus sp. MG133]|nr:hypothetical protein DL767_003616 [Monosporascus sp. MG133]
MSSALDKIKSILALADGSTSGPSTPDRVNKSHYRGGHQVQSLSAQGYHSKFDPLRGGIKTGPVKVPAQVGKESQRDHGHRNRDTSQAVSLAATDEQIKKLNADLEAALHGWNREKQQWQLERTQLMERIQQLEMGVDDPASSSTFTGIETNGARNNDLSDLEKLEMGHTKLESDLAAKTGEIKELRAAWRKTAEELAKLKSLEPRFTSNDDVIISNWKRLRCSVMDFCYDAFRSPIHAVHPSATQIRAFQCLTPNWREYLETDSLRPQIFAAYIWHKSILRILEHTNTVLGGDRTAAFDSLNEYLEGATCNGELTKKEHRSWKAQTASMLSKSSTIDNEAIQRYAYRIAKVPLQVLPDAYDEAATSKLFDSASELAVQATELARLFACSLPDYRPEMGGDSYKGFKVDEESMEVVAQNHNASKVDLVRSPCLFKYGNSFGESYDKGSVLVKAEVLL